MPNNFEINWDGGHIFHLTLMDTVTCDSAGLLPNPPAAGFDRLMATGHGTFDGGKVLANITFTFTDHGEPGNSGPNPDTVNIVITGGPSTKNSAAGVRLNTNGTVFLTGGNQQAHGH